MIPIPQLAVELVLAVGAALFAANVWVLLRPAVERRTGGQAKRPTPRPTSVRRAWLNVIIGAVVTVWAAATLLTR